MRARAGGDGEERERERGRETGKRTRERVFFFKSFHFCSSFFVRVFPFFEKKEIILNSKGDHARVLFLERQGGKECEKREARTSRCFFFFGSKKQKGKCFVISLSLSLSLFFTFSQTRWQT